VEVATWLRSRRRQQYELAFPSHAIEAAVLGDHRRSEGPRGESTWAPAQTAHCDSQRYAAISAQYLLGRRSRPRPTPAADRDVIRTSWLYRDRGRFRAEDLRDVIPRPPAMVKTVAPFEDFAAEYLGDREYPRSS